MASGTWRPDVPDLPDNLPERVDDALVNLEVEARLKECLGEVFTDHCGEPDRTAGRAVWTMRGPSDEDWAAFLAEKEAQKAQMLAASLPWSRARRERFLRARRRGEVRGDEWFSEGRTDGLSAGYAERHRPLGRGVPTLNDGPSGATHERGAEGVAS
jgi:hypothetical protein